MWHRWWADRAACRSDHPTAAPRPATAAGGHPPPRPARRAPIRPAARPPLDAGNRAERAARNAGLPTVEFAEATPYEEYVGVRQLQALVRPVTDSPAEPAFLVVTQVMELWFTLLRREWELAQRQLREDDL